MASGWWRSPELAERPDAHPHRVALDRPQQVRTGQALYRTASRAHPGTRHRRARYQSRPPLHGGRENFGSKSDGSFYWRADTPVRQSASAVGLDPDALPLSDHKLDEAFVARRKIQRTYFRGGRYTIPDDVDAATIGAVMDVVWSLLRLRFEVDKPNTAEETDVIIMRLCHGEPERIRNLLVEHKYLVYRKKTNVYLRTGESADNPDDLIAQYVKNDRLTALPDAPEQRKVALRWLTGKFALRKRFDRNEVDAMIEAHKPANATVVEVRTALMKEELLDHKGTTFWRVA